MEAGPKLTTLIDSCHRVIVSSAHCDIPVATGWMSVADMPVLTRRLVVSVSSWGRLIVMQGVFSPHKDLPISANLGGGIHFHFPGLPRGVGTHCEKLSGMPMHLARSSGGWGGYCRCCWRDDKGSRASKVGMVAADVIGGTTKGLEHPRKGVVTKEPRGWALWVLLQLCSLTAFLVSSSSSLKLLKDVIFFQGEGGIIGQDICICKGGPMAPLLPWNLQTHAAS